MLQYTQSDIDKANAEFAAWRRNVRNARRLWIANVNNGTAECIDGANSRMRRNWRKARGIIATTREARAEHYAPNEYGTAEYASIHDRIGSLVPAFRADKAIDADMAKQDTRACMRSRCSNY